MLQWFRKKLSAAEEAPPEAAAPRVGTEDALPASDGGPEGTESKPRRRRGTRGGRGRKKTGARELDAQPEKKPETKRELRRGERRRPDPKKAESAEERPRRQRRPRVQSKRPELPPVTKEILVSVDVGEQRVAVLEEGKPAEVYLERRGRRSIAGNVYKGIVDNVLPGMEASFVDIGLEKNGFLYVDEIVVPELEGKRHARKIQELIQRGERVLVQAVKDPMGTKGARLTTEISLPGRFLVYTPFGEGIGVSRRLEDAERERLKAITKAFELPDGGIIVRTAAEGATEEELAGDLALLRKLWATIQGRAENADAPALVYQEAELPLRTIRDLFNRGFERVVVDHERTHRRIVGYLKRTSPELTTRVELYRDKQPLMERYGVDDAIRSTVERRVDLPSGGYLIFDYAEAFTVVDVNTGRFVGSRGKTGNGAKLEDTITKNNLEAVEEVVRQLRLRDIGGIIVIDFIDMANPKNRELVEDALRRELDRDRTKTYVVEISPLGLVEMTRQNVTDGPREILTVACPTCAGDAVVVSAETHAINIERKLRGLARSFRTQAFCVEMNPRVASILIGPGGARLAEIEAETGRRFVFETDPSLPLEHFAVLAKGPISKLASEKFALERGQEVEVTLEARDVDRPMDAVARLDGYAVAVADAGGLVGRSARVRVERAERHGAYAVLADARTVAPPIEAEIALTNEDGSQPELAADAIAPVVEDGERPAAASADGATAADGRDGGEAAAERPKKRTRRGTRGGRGRRKKTDAAGAVDASADGVAPEAAVEAPPDPEQAEDPPIEIGSETPPADEEDAAAVEAGEIQSTTNGEAPKARRKTRRGTRGGRNRRKKRPAEADVNGAEPSGDDEARDRAASEAALDEDDAPDAVRPATAGEESG